jgi:hypothetical protein
VIWNIGYERTHGKPPESALYDELSTLQDQGLIWWLVRMDQGYVDAQGSRHWWKDPDRVASLGPRTLCFVTSPEHAQVAHRANALGLVPKDPQVRNLFLPDAAPEHFGYFVEGPPADPPLHDHVLFHLRAFRQQRRRLAPFESEDDFRARVAEHFFAGFPDGAAWAEDLLLLERLVLDQRLCLYRSAARVWGDLDGGEAIRRAKASSDILPRLAAIAARSPGNAWAEQVFRCASALREIALRA